MEVIRMSSRECLRRLACCGHRRRGVARLARTAETASFPPVVA
jgi:hypothetical protein